MDAAAAAPRILANHRGVAFDLVRAIGSVECVVALEALEAYFWLEPGASDARTLKCFGDGYQRITAIAARKALAHPAATIELTSSDFARGR
ncbi:DUF1488 family protein [Caballeronia telluris]|uniref:Uncharacterized protein n=1 Tax=Caballeronia telluris TaxID=326475 RepID=A0A158K6F5_9BURK|nr:DUF1488 family protein [Caballeronia telluris]SAL76041.1 hypothetical protein AWB66_05316 [Caballeronia telluris]